MIGRIITTLDRKYALGLLTGLVFGLLSVYTDFFRNNNPALEFDILSNTTVIDLKENISKIDILYDSSSILSENKTLSLITIKVSNPGNSDILLANYYEKFPIGLTILDGQLLEQPTIIQTNNSFLSESVEIKRKSDTEIQFNNFIFEKDNFFTLKLLVIHNISRQPKIKPNGKIVGVNEIKILNTFLNKGEKSFWEKVFDGSFLIHVTRFFSYLIIIIIFSLLIFLPIAFVGDFISKEKRKKAIKNFKTQRNKPFSDNEMLFVDFYLENGEYALKYFKTITTQYRKYSSLFNLLDPGFNPDRFYRHRESRPEQLVTLNFIRELKDRELVRIEDKQVIFIDNLDKFASDLLQFISEK